MVFLNRTLIRSASIISSNSTNAIRLIPSRLFSTVNSNSSSQLPESSSSSSSEAEALTVKRIEDAIHRYIVKRSAPDWLPFVPGASYWVPPKRRTDGIADLIHKIANAPTHEQLMSLTISRGWPSSAFYINDESSHQKEGVETSSQASLSEDEEG